MFFSGGVSFFNLSVNVTQPKLSLSTALARLEVASSSKSVSMSNEIALYVASLLFDSIFLDDSDV